MKRKSISARPIASGKSEAARSIASGDKKAASKKQKNKKGYVYVSCSSEEDDVPDYIPPVTASYKPVYCKNEIHDTTSAIPIVLDVLDLIQKGISLGNYEDFIVYCYSNSKLLAYDQPDPSPFGPYYLEGENVAGWHLEVAEFAFDWYKKNCPGGSRKEWIQEKTKMNIAYSFCYVSFIVVDEDTKEETRIQAMLLAPPLYKSEWQIGMVRDATQEQVLAIIKLKQDTTEAIIDKNFWNALKFIGKKALVMT